MANVQVKVGVVNSPEDGGSSVFRGGFESSPHKTQAPTRHLEKGASKRDAPQLGVVALVVPASTIPEWYASPSAELRCDLVNFDPDL